MQPYQEFTGKDRTPLRYELLWDSKASAFVLRIHKIVLTYLEARLKKSAEGSYVKEMEKDYKLRAFVVNPEESLGYGGIIKRSGETDELVEFLLPLPETSRFEDLVPFSASLSVLTSHLRDCGIETDSGNCQLMNFWTNTCLGLCSGCSVRGEVSKFMGDWLRAKYEKRDMSVLLPSVRKSMQAAYCHVIGEKTRDDTLDDDTLDFEVRIGISGFYIDYLRGTCGLNPTEDYELRKEKGYGFGCHNVDSLIQQLMLLVGLAALWTKAKEEIKESTENRSM
jgi:hypothetical protein